MSIPAATLPPDTVRRPRCGRSVAWHSAVPQLVNGGATLREISVGDAAALLEHLADRIALRHVAPCPATIAEIRRFARWARETRRRGRLICFAVIPAGYRRPAGLMQLWPLDRDGTTAEWGVVIGRAFWGSGLFTAAASLLLQFAFDSLGVARLEARTAVDNDRAGAAMQKIGATAEACLSERVTTERAMPDVHRWSFSPSSAHIAAGMRGNRPLRSHAPGSTST